MKKDKVDWKKLWSWLCADTTESDIEVEVTESEMNALDDFAEFLGKMNPPKNPALPLDIRLDNDVKFRKFLKTQFKEPDI